MKAFFKFLLNFFISLIGIMGFLFCLIAVTLYFFDVNAHKDVIEKIFVQQTGQRLLLNGPIKVTFFPVPALKVENSMIQIPFDKGRLDLNASLFTFNLDLVSLFTDVVKINGVKASNVVITLFDQHKKGKKIELDSVVATLISTPCEIKLPTCKVKIDQNEFEGAFFFSTKTKTIDAKGKIKSARLNWNKLIIKNVDIGLNIKGEQITADAKGNIGGGTLVGHFFIDKLLSVPMIQANIKIKGAKAKALLENIPSPSLEGKVNLSFEGESKGDNQKSFINALSGKLLIHFQDLVLKQKMQKDLFSMIWLSLTPQHKSEALECAALRFKIHNGIFVANQGVALETKEVYALGSGQFTLSSQKLDFVFDFSSRSPIKLSLGSMNKVVYLKGTLSNPQWEPSPTGIVMGGGSLILSIVTGGASLLAEKLIQLTNQKTSPCEMVLNES